MSISMHSACQSGLLVQHCLRQTAGRLTGRAVDNAAGAGFVQYIGDNGILLAEGDSWFDYPFYDVLQTLEGKYQYKVESTAHKGDTLESMVYDEEQLAGLALKMKRLSESDKNPSAILLSGGGNDIAGQELGFLLNHAASGLPTLNESIVSGVVDVRMRVGYSTFLQAVTNLSEHYFKRRLPVLIHGYDYPIPDGRGFLGGGWFLPGPWLKPYMEQKGYSQMEENAKMLRTILLRFNAMLAAIPKQPGFEHVCYVPVAGTLSSVIVSGKYEDDWGNELHPTRAGFRKVADKFQLALMDCAKVPQPTKAPG